MSPLTELFEAKLHNEFQGGRAERNRQRAAAGSTNPTAVQRSKSWRPSLQSISESPKV
jgi:hypothetical protein